MIENLHLVMFSFVEQRVFLFQRPRLNIRLRLLLLKILLSNTILISNHLGNLSFYCAQLALFNFLFFPRKLVVFSLRAAAFALIIIFSLAQRFGFECVSNSNF